MALQAELHDTERRGRGRFAETMRNPVVSFTASINGYYIRSTILSLLNGMLLRLEHEQVITIPIQPLGARSH